MKSGFFNKAVTRSLFVFFLFIFSFHISYSQSFKGKDGAANLSAAGTYILNRYTTLANSVVSGQLSLTVSDINQLKGTYSFSNAYNPYITDALSQGDLIMIIQVQGAEISTANNAGYGAIVNYNNTGNYELKTVFQVSGNTIYFCEGLQYNYSQAGTRRTQIIRIPRLSSFTAGAGVVVSGKPWDGSVGGVVALDVNGNMSVDGEVSASSIGFRGGVDDITVSINSTIYTNTVYVSNSSVKNDASKGESIAGNPTDYDAMSGACGRGAVANGGGGGNGHNSGGGGGSNAGTNGVLTPWNGTGLKDISTASWANAWNLEYAGFSTDVSTGGGRGGYSYSALDQDALVYGPGNSIWSGNYRLNIGGFGGRPLDYNSNSRLFFGGGGGAGEGNNSSAGNGGNGGGIVYILCNGNISGAGFIRANGQDGYSTQNLFIDAAGGAGGGGAIAVLASGSITGIVIQANGGRGGDQNYLTGEAEGPGGGGGGGYIATTTTGVTRQVKGGNNGVSYSTHVTEFLPNGATKGASGTLASVSYKEVFSCNEQGFLLPVKLISFSAAISGTDVKLNWQTENEVNAGQYIVERSVSENNGFKAIQSILALNTTSAEYAVLDNIKTTASGNIYYRLKMVEKDGSFTYSKVVQVKPVVMTSVYIYPTLLKAGQPVQLDMAGENDKVSEVSMFNMNGQLVKEKIRVTGRLTTLSTDGLQPGLYIIKVFEDHTTHSFKMIVQ